VRPILEYGAECWDLCREVQVIASDRVEKQVPEFATGTTESVWETLVQRRKIARMLALFKRYTGEWAWKATGGRLQGPCYLSREDHNRKISVTKKGKIFGNVLL